MRLVDDFFVARPLQETAVELVTSAGWQAHLRSLATALRQRLEALAVALDTRLPDCSFPRPAGGVCLWLQLPRGTDEVAVVEQGLAHGVAASPGRLYTIGEPELPHLRLSFAAIDTPVIDEAVRRLAGAVAQAK